MGFRLFGRKARDPESVDVLDLVPVPRVAHRDASVGDRLELLDPRYKSGLLGRWLQPRLKGDKAYVIVKLDEKGTQVWRLVDGERTVAAVIRAYVATFPEDAETASDRVWRFLQMAGMNGCLSFDEPGGDDGSDGCPI